MKTLVLVAALAGTLAACGNPAEESDEPAAPSATETVAEETSAGTYEYEMEGSLVTAVLNPDGTYTDTQDGTVIESGTWEDREDGKTCFDPEGEANTVQCFTVGEMADDGTFVATPDEGEPMTMKKVS